MSLKSRILFAVYILAGAACLVIMLLSVKPLEAQKIRTDEDVYGELFNMCLVKSFKVDIHQKLVYALISDRKARKPEESTVIFAGDSFFGGYMGGIFEKFTGVPSSDTKFRFRGSTPLGVLEEMAFRRNPYTRYLVYERPEKGIAYGIDPTFSEKPGNGNFDELVKRCMVNNETLEHFVTINPVFKQVMEVRNTLRFDALGEISSLTPVYSLDPLMLHYSTEIMANRENKPDAFVERLAGGISVIDRELMRRYGIKMIFVPIPNKYSLYGYEYERFSYNVAGERYDGFLPRLYKELDKRGVLYLDLYHEYLKRKDLMYHPTHGHWDDAAKKIFISRLYELYEREERLRASQPVPGTGGR